MEAKRFQSGQGSQIEARSSFGGKVTNFDYRITPFTFKHHYDHILINVSFQNGLHTYYLVKLST